MLNDLFRTYKKIIIAVVLLLSAVIFWFFGCHRFRNPQEPQTNWKQTSEGVQSYDFHTEHISGNITFGTLGYLSADRPQPVVMTVTSEKGSFIGTIKITLPGEEGKGISYQSAVRCEEGTASGVMLNVPRLGNVSFFSMEILDQYGAEELAEMIVGASGIKESSDSGEVIDKKTSYFGVLSDSYDKLEWLDDLEYISGNDSRIIRLLKIDQGDILNNVKKLGSLSGILIDDYDTARLSMRQKNCLKEWIEKEGGVLLAGTGVHSERVLSGLDSLLDVSASGEYEQNSVQFGNDEEAAGYVVLNTDRIQPGDESLWETEGFSYPSSCFHRRLGLGEAVILTWSLTDDALRQWTGREKMTRELFEGIAATGISNCSADEDSIWYLEKALYAFLNSQMPNTFYYALFFILYIAALGFFAYYVLRRMHRREHIWIVVPVISILFTVCLLIRTRGSGNNSLSSYSALEVIDADQDYQDICFLYQNNEGKSNSVDISQDIVFVEPMDYPYRTGEEDVTSLRRLRQDYTINNTRNGYDIVFEEAVPGTSQLLQFTRENGNDHNSGGCFHGNIKADYTSFQGSVTNNSEYQFEKVVLIRGSQYRILEDVGPGETAQVLAEDVLCWSGFEQDNGGYGQEEERGPVLSLVDYIRNKYMSNEEDYNTVVIAGITRDKEIALFADDHSLQNHLSIFVNRISLPSEEYMHYIADINRSCLSKEQEESVLSQDVLEENETKAVYQFDSDKSVWILARNRDSFDGTIYAYNHQTQKDEKILKKWDDIMGRQELEPYLSDTNTMTLTFSLKKDQDYGAAPVISLMLKDEDHLYD